MPDSPTTPGNFAAQRHTRPKIAPPLPATPPTNQQFLPAELCSAPVLAKRQYQVQNALDSYHFFTFGPPSVTQFSDGVIVATFYVSQEQVTYVRCYRLRETLTSS